MSRRGDERAVTVQIGAVLLLAIVFAALALYQVNAVPAENERVEFAHNQAVHDELQDLRNAIRNVGTGGGTQSTAVTLGTQYPSRTVATNPPPATGRLETIEPGSNVTIDPAGDPRTYEYETRLLAYEPDYHEYDDAPRTLIEHSLTYNRFDDAGVSLGSQQLIGSERISLLLLDGELSESDSGAASVPVELLDEPRTTTLEAGTELTIPTRRTAVWERELSEVDGVTAGATTDETITIELDREFDLEIGRVGVGSGGSSSDEFDIGTERDGSGESTAGYDVSFADDPGNAAPCDSGEDCAYSVGAGTTATFSATATASEAAFDFAYSAGNGVSIDQFDEDAAAGVVEFDAEGSGTFDLFVSSGGDSDSVTIDVRRGLVVSDVVPRDPVEAGEEMDVEITVENLRDEAVTRNVTLLVDADQTGSFADVERREVSVAGGETATVTMTYATGSGDTPEIDVRGRTEEDRNGIVRSAEVYELDDTLDVRITGTNDPIAAGETLRVTTEVRQTFGADVTLEVDGTVVDGRSVSEDGTVVLEWETAAGDVGDRSITVTAEGWFSSPTDEASVTVTEPEPPTFEVATAEVTSEKGGNNGGVGRVAFDYLIESGTDVAFTVADENGDLVGEPVTQVSDGTRTRVAVDIDDGATAPGREPRPLAVEASVVGAESCRLLIETGDGDGPFALCE